MTLWFDWKFEGILLGKIDLSSDRWQRFREWLGNEETETFSQYPPSQLEGMRKLVEEDMNDCKQIGLAPDEYARFRLACKQIALENGDDFYSVHRLAVLSKIHAGPFYSVVQERMFAMEAKGKNNDGSPGQDDRRR